MKLSLSEISAQIDTDLGVLSKLQTTEQVVRNKLRLAIDSGRIRSVKFQKRRSLKSWAQLLLAANVIERKVIWS